MNDLAKFPIIAILTVSPKKVLNKEPVIIYSLGGGVGEFWRDHMIFRGDSEGISCRLKSIRGGDYR